MKFSKAMVIPFIVAAVILGFLLGMSYFTFGYWAFNEYDNIAFLMSKARGNNSNFSTQLEMYPNGTFSLICYPFYSGNYSDSITANITINGITKTFSLEKLSIDDYTTRINMSESANDFIHFLTTTNASVTITIELFFDGPAYSVTFKACKSKSVYEKLKQKDNING